MNDQQDIAEETIKQQKDELDMPVGDGRISLTGGVPGEDQLIRTKEIIGEATKALQDAAENQLGMVFQYGMKKGDTGFRLELAKFLEEQTDIKPDIENLVVTAGSTQGVYFVTSLFLRSGATVFIEDPTYFLMLRLLRDDLKMNIVPVPVDDEGIMVDRLEELINKHVRKDQQGEEMFSCMLYTIPTFHNPTSRCLSPDRCRILVKLARKYDMLVLADDVYLVLQAGNQHKPPPRLLTYDNRSDCDYKGHVVSSGSFSKILGPGLRIGWLEAGDRIIQRLINSAALRSGGCFNQFGACVLAQVMKLNLLTPHVQYIRQQFQERISAMCDILDKKLPQGSKWCRPEGGYFIWIELPSSLDTAAMLPAITERKNVTFLPGIRCSPSGSYQNCLRLSFGHFPISILIKAVNDLCDGIQEYLHSADN